MCLLSSILSTILRYSDTLHGHVELQSAQIDGLSERKHWHLLCLFVDYLGSHPKQWRIQGDAGDAAASPSARTKIF